MVAKQVRRTAMTDQQDFKGLKFDHNIIQIGHLTSNDFLCPKPANIKNISTKEKFQLIH